MNEQNEINGDLRDEYMKIQEEDAREREEGFKSMPEIPFEDWLRQVEFATDWEAEGHRDTM